MEPGSTNSIGGSQAGSSLVPPPKRPHLEPGEGGIWPYSTNKPVGIAQPFQKKESVEIEPVENLQKEDMCEQEEDLKAGLSLDFKPKPDLNAKDASFKEIFGPSVDKTRKFSGKRHSSTESDTDSDSSSSFSYQFGPPSESSDDAALGGGGVGEADRGEHGEGRGDYRGSTRECGETSKEREAAAVTRTSGGGQKEENVDVKTPASIAVGMCMLVHNVHVYLHVG